MRVTLDRFRIPNIAATRLAKRGFSLPELARRAGLPPRFFQREKLLVSTSELFAFWRAIAEISGDPALGLKIGWQPRFEQYHPSAVAAICSRSYRDALQRIARYKQLTCPEEIRVRTVGAETTVEMIFIHAQESEPDILVNLALSWLYSIAHHGTDGAIKPLRVELKRTEDHRALLEKHFGCRAKFKAARNAVVFRSLDLDRPFVTQNDELLQIIGAHLENQLAEVTGASTLQEQVKRALKASLAGQRPSLPRIAQDLGVSSRTLQRRLGALNITFQQAVVESRRELAQHYLQHSALEFNEVAYLVGYEDANSFFRAFQAWEGSTPGAWREARRATAGAAKRNGAARPKKTP